MSDPIEIDDRLTIPASDLSYEFSRSGGPGGQHVNTTDTRVRLRFAMGTCELLHPMVKERIRAAHPSKVNDEGELLLVCDEYRSRQRNIDAVRKRLVDVVLASLKPPKKRKATKPSRAAKRRRMDAKKRRGNVKKGRGKVRHDD